MFGGPKKYFLKGERKRKREIERQVVKYSYFPKLNFSKYTLNSVFHWML